MIAKILKELEETWGFSTEELNDIREHLEDACHSSYTLGFSDARKELDIESEYYSGFSYGKKVDLN